MPTSASIRINSGTAGVANVDLPLDTVVSLTNADNTGVVAYEWVIVSQPAGTQDDLTPHDPPPAIPTVSSAAAPTFTPTKEGSYLIRLTVNKGLADEAIDTTICAVRELQTGDRIPAPQETTEVSDTEGWATAAVTKILQRVTRLSDSGIFVAQNASGGDLEVGHVVHLNGMVTIGVAANARKIPTVDVAFANDIAKVDGPLGVMVGNTAGESLTVADGALCRVMVIGALPAYSFGTSAAIGASVFVGNDGFLSLTAGDNTRQVGDIAAEVVAGDTYDVAISAAANSIPRGNAGGDLAGAYPDPTVARINETLVASASGKAEGHVLRLVDVAPSDPTAEWGPVDLANSDAVAGTLPVSRGGTGSTMDPTRAGAIVYQLADGSLATNSPGSAGYLLKSMAPSQPQWIQTVPAESGGTGIAGGYTAGAMLYANGANSLTQLPPTATSTRGILQSKGTGAAPVWIVNGTSGYPLVSNGPGADAAFEQLNLVTATTGTLPVSKGGTGSGTALTAGGVIVATSTTAMTSLALPVASGSVLLGSNAGLPSWAARLPVASGGTNVDLSGVTGINGVVCKISSSSLGVTDAGSAGAILSASLAGSPTWKTAGSAGQILTLTTVAGLNVLDWQDFADYFNAQYAGSFADSTITYSTTGGAYTPIVSVTNCDLEIGNITVSCVPNADGLPFSNTITTASNGAATTVSLKYVVTGPVGFGTKNYIYQFRSSTAHNNNQVTGSITFPTFTFRATVQGSYDVALQATVTAGDTFQVLNIAMRVTQG